MQMVDAIAASGGFARIATPPDESRTFAHPFASAATPSTGAPEPKKSGAAPTDVRPTAMGGRDYSEKAVGDGEWEHKGAGAVDGVYAWLKEVRAKCVRASRAR